MITKTLESHVVSDKIEHSLEAEVHAILEKIPKDIICKIEKHATSLSFEEWSNLHSYAYELILDGRYLETLPCDLRSFGQINNIKLSEELYNWLETESAAEVLEDLKNIAQAKIEFMSVVSPIRADFGTSVVIIIGADAIIVVVTVASCQKETIITDESPEADLKL